MKTLILATMFLLSACHAENKVFETKAIIRAVNCDDSFLNGRYCITAAKYINGPYRGQTCTNARLVGAVGDTIQVSITVTSYDNYCQMR